MAGLYFRWLGVGGVQLRYGKKILLVDPFLTRPSLREVIFHRLESNLDLLRDEIPRADAIFITHAHYDHLMDAPAIVKQTGAAVYGSNNVVKLLLAAGLPAAKCVLIQNGDCFDLDPFQVEVIEGKHISFPFFTPKPLPQTVNAPQRVWDYQMDACFSFSILLAETSILIWHSMEAKGAVPAQVLLVDVEMPFSTVELLLQIVNPRIVIPIHWDDFFRPLSMPLKTFFRPPEKGFFHLGRLEVTAYVRRFQQLLPAGRVYLPERLKEINLSSLLG